MRYQYSGFARVTRSHSGAVNTTTSPRATYAYSNGSANHARRTSVTCLALTCPWRG